MRSTSYPFGPAAFLRFFGSEIPYGQKVENLRRTIGSVGMPPQETNRFGRRADFALLESSDSRNFSPACPRVILSGDVLSAPFRALLQQAREHGVKVIVVEMPVHPSHLKQFYAEPIWTTFRAKTRTVVENAGGSLFECQ